MLFQVLDVFVPSICHLKIVAEIGQDYQRLEKVAKIQILHLDCFTRVFTLKKLELDILDNILCKSDDIGMMTHTQRRVFSSRSNVGESIYTCIFKLK